MNQEIKCHEDCDIKTILDEVIMKPHNIQIPGIVNIVDDYLEFGTKILGEYAYRGLGYRLQSLNIPNDVLPTCLTEACRGGHPEIVEFLISKCVDQLHQTWVAYSLATAFKEACRSGHKEVVELLIFKGAAKDWHLRSAYKGVVELLKISEDAVDDWNSALDVACEGGHIELVDLMIFKGANDWNRGLGAACIGGHKELVEFMISKGANDFDWGWLLAWTKGHKEIMKLMISKGA